MWLVFADTVNWLKSASVLQRAFYNLSIVTAQVLQDVTADNRFCSGKRIQLSGDRIGMPNSEYFILSADLNSTQSSQINVTTTTLQRVTF